MNAVSVFSITSIAIVFVALSIGVYTDITTRLCPRWIWYVCAPFAAASTICWYFQSVLTGNSAIALSAFITSVILCPLCVYMGYRMGNGGDWRSLFFISLLTPWVSALTLLLSALFGGFQILLEIYTQRKTPGVWKSTVPWMVAITLAFVAASVAYFFI